MKKRGFYQTIYLGFLLTVALLGATGCVPKGGQGQVPADKNRNEIERVYYGRSELA